MENIPLGLCQCGCGEKTTVSKYTDTKKGMVNGRPMLFIQGHHLIAKRKTYGIDKNGCWIWKGIPYKSGYATVSFNSKRHYAHRWMYEQHKGKIPEGLQLDHLCRVRNCVNPDHLEPVTCAENNRRGKNVKLNTSDVLLIKKLLKDYRRGVGVKIAKIFNISGGHISQIKRGNFWGDI